MEFGGRAQMVFAEQRRAVPVLLQYARPRERRLRQASSVGAFLQRQVIGDTDLGAVQAGQECHTAGRADRRRDKGIIELGPLAREPIDVRRDRFPITVRAD